MILYCCVILHNMCVEARRDDFTFSDATSEPPVVDEHEDQQATVSLFSFEADEEFTGADNVVASLALRIGYMTSQMANEELHHALQQDLIAHIYDKY